MPQGDVIIALNLAARLDATTDFTSMIHDSFPSVLKHWGDPYSIKLKPDAKPHALLPSLHTRGLTP